MTRKLSLRHLLLLVVLTCSYPAVSQTLNLIVKKGQIEKDLQDVNSRFYFRGHPINPKIVNAFLPWMSDSRPSVISIDLETATGSNQFYLNPEDTGTYANLGFTGEMDKGWCSYEYLGKTESNIHVVRVSTNGGGSGIFGSILFFSFKAGKNFDSHGEKREQLLMTVESFYMEGDRSKAQVSIIKNKVRIDKPASMNKVVEIEF